MLLSLITSLAATILIHVIVNRDCKRVRQLIIHRKIYGTAGSYRLLTVSLFCKTVKWLLIVLWVGTLIEISFNCLCNGF